VSEPIASLAPDPVVVGRPTDAELSETLTAPVYRRHFTILIGIFGTGAICFLVVLFYTFFAGIGTWGNNIPIGWALGITNFVWWIGIGHAGTFISAFLLLLEQKWRTSINRFAEAMTLFAVMMAGIYPVAHLGRAWFAYWLIPYPSTMGVWPQFRSALAWDIAAISTYFTVSLLFWYLGLIPDLAIARDTAPTLRRRRIYGIFSLGWRGSSKQWRWYKVSYGILAGLATPLVISVHTIVSFDFAIAKLPGWHSTIFPPYFVAGALFSGFAMVITLLVPLRKYLRFEKVITIRHLDAMAMIMMLTGSIVSYAYLLEHFLAWYSGHELEQYALNQNRPFGTYGWMFWLQILINVGCSQILWIRRVRRSPWVLFAISILINVGMWLERFTIIVGTLNHDFLPSAWADYTPSIIDGALFFGSISFFLFLFLLFMRLVPSIPIWELKEMLHEEEHR
jgi:molybdopterin-containing oxidoreductase family membrane subunit